MSNSSAKPWVITIRRQTSRGVTCTIQWTNFWAVYRPKLHACGVAADCRYENRRPAAVNERNSTVFSTDLSAAPKMTPSGGKPGVKVGERAGATQEGVELTLRLRAHGPRERLPERAIESLFGEAGEDRIAPAQPLFEEYGPEIARKASEERDTVISFFFT